MQGSQSTQNESGQRRDFDRLPLGVPAKAIAHYNVMKVVLVDLSQGGAQIMLPNDDEFLTDCMLTWLDFEAFGSASWREGRFVGINWEEPLSHKVVLATRRRAEEMSAREDARQTEQTRRWVQGWQG